MDQLDEFAKAAMQEILAKDYGRIRERIRGHHNNTYLSDIEIDRRTREVVARCAYDMAEAMLAESKRRKEKNES